MYEEDDAITDDVMSACPSRIFTLVAIREGQANITPYFLRTPALNARLMKSHQIWRIASAFLFTLFNGVFASAAALHWKCSTAENPWVDQPDLQSRMDVPPTTQPISVDTNRHLQTIDGWGGCFNERGWRAMQVLTDEQRDKVMRMLFDPKNGLKLNLCRTPIAASDYAIDLYSYDETPGDYQMEHFSIDRDRQMLIPYIKAALAIQPGLKLWAVPWSPPSWMKGSGVLAGGHIKSDAQTMDALALYFAKYVQAYQAEGVPLFMVMPQNEPCYSTKYTSCEWTGAEIAGFIRDHLGPLFKQLHVNCEIWIGTIPRSDPKKLDYDYWLAPSLDDPLIRVFVTGVGCQWGGAGVMRDAHSKHPEMKLMQSEAECGDKNTNDWAYASKRFEEVVNYFDCGAQSFMIWNLVLDETGLSTAGWAQCSPIVVDQLTEAITYTPYFYAVRHFSSFVRPGAIRVAAGGGTMARDAFVNVDGSLVLVVENIATAPTVVSITIGDNDFAASLPGKSFNTFVLDGGVTQTIPRR